MKALTLLPLLLVFSGCTPSSLILTMARNEYDTINSSSTRQDVDKHLGVPLLCDEISPPSLAEDFQPPDIPSEPNSRFRDYRGFYLPSYVPAPEDRKITAHCRYKSRGKIVPHGYAGDAIAMTYMTLGIGEILALPMAIREVTPDASIMNEFDVWYLAKGQVLAYHWVWRAEKNEGKKLNSSTETTVPATTLPTTQAPNQPLQ